MQHVGIMINNYWNFTHTNIIAGLRVLPRGPLSPLLFILVLEYLSNLEYLSKLTQTSTANKQLDLYKMVSAIVESHLAFADDVVFFYSASIKSLTTLKSILNDFTSFSRLEVTIQNVLSYFLPMYMTKHSYAQS